MWGFCWREGTSAGVELPLVGQGVGLMVWELTPPSPTLPATDLLASLFLGGNKSLTHSERRNACGCCAMRPEGISWVLILPAASRGSDRPPQRLCCWEGPIASHQAATPQLLPRRLSLCPEHGSKPSSAENWRANLKLEVPGRASPAFPVVSVAPKPPCPGRSRPPARGAAMPRAARAPGPGPPPGGRRKQNKTGLGVNII